MSNFLHVSGYENRAMRRNLLYTKAGKKVNPLTGLTALQEAGHRVLGATYNVGRNARKRERILKARAALLNGVARREMEKGR